MKFLVDENIGRSIVNYLREQEHEVIWVKETNSGMTDIEILQLAFRSKLVLITYDQDFGELVFNQNAEHYGVLLLRLGLNTPDIHVEALKNFLAGHSQKEIVRVFWKIDERYL